MEHVLYDDGEVFVSRARAVFASKTYPLRGITAIQAVCIWPNFHPAVLLGALAFLATCLSATLPDWNPAARNLAVISGTLAAIASTALYLFGWRYAVIIDTASGEHRAFVCKDEQRVIKIADAMNEAVVQFRGQ